MKYLFLFVAGFTVGVGGTIREGMFYLAGFLVATLYWIVWGVK